MYDRFETDFEVTIFLQKTLLYHVRAENFTSSSHWLINNFCRFFE